MASNSEEPAPSTPVVVECVSDEEACSHERTPDVAECGSDSEPGHELATPQISVEYSPTSAGGEVAQEYDVSMDDLHGADGNALDAIVPMVASDDAGMTIGQQEIAAARASLQRRPDRVRGRRHKDLWQAMSVDDVSGEEEAQDTSDQPQDRVAQAAHARHQRVESDALQLATIAESSSESRCKELVDNITVAASTVWRKCKLVSSIFQQASLPERLPDMSSNAAIDRLVTLHLNPAIATPRIGSWAVQMQGLTCQQHTYKQRFFELGAMVLWSSRVMWSAFMQHILHRAETEPGFSLELIFWSTQSDETTIKMRARELQIDPKKSVKDQIRAAREAMRSDQPSNTNETVKLIQNILDVGVVVRLPDGRWFNFYTELATHLQRCDHNSAANYLGSYQALTRVEGFTHPEIVDRFKRVAILTCDDSHASNVKRNNVLKMEDRAAVVNEDKRIRRLALYCGLHKAQKILADQMHLASFCITGVVLHYWRCTMRWRPGNP